MHPDRVVVGVQHERAAEVMADVYRPLYLRDFPIMTTDLESAEMIKYAANAFLATKITFINEIAALCERTGADVKMVSKGMGMDGRIGNKIKRRMIDKILDICEGNVNGKIIAILGVTFKPNTDDMRDAPALTIVPALVGAGAKVRVVDPQGFREGEELLPGVNWVDDVYKAAQNADAVVILTEWNEFRALDLMRLAKRMATPAMADLRNVYSQKDARRAGFTAYTSVGRPDYGIER